MPHLPDYHAFQLLAAEHTVVPVYRQLISDTITPVSAFARLPASDWSFLLESVIGGERVGRYSFLGAWPFLRFEAHGDRVTIHEGDTVREMRSADPLAELGRLASRHRAPHLPGLPRFTGGAVGY